LPKAIKLILISYHLYYKLAPKKENISYAFINLIENLQKYNIEKISIIMDNIM